MPGRVMPAGMVVKVNVTFVILSSGVNVPWLIVSNEKRRLMYQAGRSVRLHGCGLMKCPGLHTGLYVLS